MQTRIPMNSKSLQEHFPEVYRDFFSKCPVVVSTPGSFVWSGEYSSIFGGFSITQLLPFRVYVGIEPVSSPKLTSGSYLVFNSSLAKFEVRPHDRLISVAIFKLLDTEIPKITQKNQNNGFILHILSEVPTERGLNTSGAIAAALATALHLIYKKDFQTEKIKHWSNLPLPKLIINHDFNELYRLAWKIESIYHAGTTSGRGAFVPFVHSTYPVIYFTEKRTNVFGSDEQASLGQFNKINYWAFRLNEFFDIHVPAYYWPIDFGLIYSGYENSTASIIRMIPNIQDDFKEIAEKILAKFQQKIPDEKAQAICRFYDYCAKSEGKELWERIIETLGIISLKIASSFDNLIKKGHSDEYLQAFFKSINQCQNILHILEASTTSIDHICNSLYERSRKLDIVSGVGAKLTGAGHGGDVLFASPIGIFRKSIEELMMDFKNNYNKEITLDYASWLDGYGEEGILAEQDLEEKIYSSHVSQGGAKVIHLNRQGKLHVDLYTLEEFNNLKNKADILFDTVNEEVYIRGERLTSKEIHSASTTVEILKILLSNLGKEVRNNQLPSSSYTQDRNELQNKIIGPLTRIVAKKTGYPLPLKLQGGLLDFMIKLDKGELDIYLLEKVF